MDLYIVVFGIYYCSFLIFLAVSIRIHNRFNFCVFDLLLAQIDKLDKVCYVLFNSS